MDREQFASPGREYRGVTLWMLNDKLELDEIERQLDGLADAGWGAMIGRTFNGLLTEYLSDEWMEIIGRIISRARRHGMRVWLQAGYMPSAVPDLPADRAHKGLSRRARGESPADGETVLAEDDAFVYCEETSATVLDLLNPDAVTDYLDLAYKEPWFDRFGDEFGKAVEAIWVDEPHFRPPLLPWCDSLPGEFQQQWGYALTDHLPSLFGEVGDHRKVRHHYWRTVTGMFIDAYFKRVGQWCTCHGVKFSGHLMGEDTLNNQVAWTGATMACYEHMHLPGIDHLTMSLTWPSGKKFILTPKQCTSVGSQLGKAEMLCEMYGVSSQGITFEDRKQIGDWMAVLGINTRCYHGSFYSLRGRRKRIYAPNLSYQQPWWPDNRLVADYFARVSYALRQGSAQADVLVVHPVESAMCLYDPMAMDRPHDRSTEREDVKILDDRLVDLCDHLLRIHRGWEFGDEALMARHAKVAGDGLAVGQMTYKAVVLPAMITIRRSTAELLKEFAAAGGTVLSAGDFPTRIDGTADKRLAQLRSVVRTVENSPAALKRALDAAVAPEIEITAANGDAANVWVHARQLDEGRLYFLVNTSRERGVDAEVALRGTGRVESWDLRTGDVAAPPQRRDGDQVVSPLPLPPLGSCLLLLREGEPGAGVEPSPRKVLRTVELSPPLAFTRHAPNAVTLDTCRWRKGDGPWNDPIPVIGLQGRLDEEQYKGPLSLEFGFNVEAKPEKLCVAVENAAGYRIAVNGQSVAYAGLPYYVDRSFHPTDITREVREGDNVIELSIDFRPLPRASFALASLYEVKRGVELESIYLTGDFAVKGRVSSGTSRPRCVRYAPAFTLAAEKETTTGDLSGDGYPFYAGRFSLLAAVTLERPAKGERVLLELPSLDAALARVRVNGRDAGAILWPPYDLDITDCVTGGRNRIEIELVSTLRNLLGPHHRSTGEPDNCWRTAFDYAVDREGVQHAEEREATWTDDYFFVHFGVRGLIRLKHLAARG